tara:strand:+ start:9974 stop:10441 length:468 start_codon:yes stop_codon:yes gene_type:complete
MNNIIISKYKPEYSQSFYKLNKEWITEFWDLESSDLNNLLNPEKSIVNVGGEIFFAILNNHIIGTAAMIPEKNGVYELAKMTIHKRYRGNGISKKLLEACIDFAISKQAKEIFLISNRLLLIARELYNKYGFQEVALNSKKYDRGNVKMTLSLVE